MPSSSSKKPKYVLPPRVPIAPGMWVYACNNGDGSTGARYFSTEAKAEAYAAHDDERHCDDIWQINTVVIDPKHWSEE